MALPKGFIKNLKLSKPKVGFERRQEMLDDIADKGTFLPRGVSYEDIDSSFIEFVENDLSIVIDGKKVPVIFLTLQKWSEFSKTWQHSDKYKNIDIPFITIVRQPNPQVGTNQGGLFNEAGVKTYTYIKVPTFEGGRKGIDVYKIPQPTSVDIFYDIRIFCNRIGDMDLFNSKIQNIFKSIQHYLYVNKHPMPLQLESINDESVVDYFDKRKYYVQMVETKLLGYILNEESFEIVPIANRLRVNESIISAKVEPNFRINKVNNISEINYSFVIKPNIRKFSFTADFDTKFNSISTNKLNNVIFKVNNVTVTLPFLVNSGDVIKVSFDKNYYDTGELDLYGEII